MKQLIIRANTYDWVNCCIWPSEVLKETVYRSTLPGYRFDETDQCVYWEGEPEEWKVKFREQFPCGIA